MGKDSIYSPNPHYLAYLILRGRIGGDALPWEKVRPLWELAAILVLAKRYVSRDRRSVTDLPMRNWFGDKRSFIDKDSNFVKWEYSTLNYYATSKKKNLILLTNYELRILRD